MQKISDYIIGELKRTLNSDVNKIMLSGGVTETYGLIDYLEKQLREARLSVDIVTFDDYRSDDDTFTILSNEDSTFCAGGRRSNSLRLWDTNSRRRLRFLTVPGYTTRISTKRY